MSDATAREPRGVLRNAARWLVRKYYPNIEITDAERIPQSGPVLLCANHANSLIDPIMIGIAAGRPVRFMAKAPLFDHPVLGPPMRALGMIPAYRGRDDGSDVRKNVESLDVAAQALVAGQAMGIFPEGVSSDEAQLKMIRSGAARMALQAAADGAKGIQVVPIGISYDRKDEFRSSAWVRVGQPIDVDACLAEYEGNDRQARRGLTQQLETNLKEVVVHLDEAEWEPWLDDLQTLAEMPAEPDRAPVPPLRKRKRTADAMNYFLAHDRARAESIAGDIEAYRNDVHAAGLRVDSPVLRTHGLETFGKLLWEGLWLALLLIPALIGTWHHLVPFVAVRHLARRMDQPGRKTISTNRLLVGAPVYVLWYVVVAWWMIGYEYSTWFIASWLIAAPFCGVIAVHYWRRAGEAAQLLWHQVRVLLRTGKLQELREQEAAIRQRLAELATEYAAIVPREETAARAPRVRSWARVATRAAAVLLVALLAWIATYWFVDDSLDGNGLDLAHIEQTRLEELLADDEETLTHLLDGIDDLGTDAVNIYDEFKDGRRSFTKQADNDDVRELLRRYLTYRQALLRIIWKYQHYDDIDPQRQDLRLRAFLADFTAAAELYHASLTFVHLFRESSDAIAKLNEPEPNWGIPPRVYDTIRHNLASRKNVRMFDLAVQFYHQQAVQDRFREYGLVDAAPYDQFHAAIAEAEKTIRHFDRSMPEKVVVVAIDDLGQMFKTVQYATQSAVSTWIGDFKIRQPHKGRSLIDERQLSRLAAELQPGDVLLERRNWYLSNAFLPGYWPHGAVYVGNAKDLRKRGLHENEHVRKHFDRFAEKDPEGHDHVIIEAVSEGVIFSSLEHSIGGADSVAVLRPRVSEEAKNEAIARAFSFAGRPYDFEFDFESTDKLVCTEVVYRSYGGNSGPIDFPLQRVMGRQTMPAINLVKKFNQEYGSDEAQFEFIAFIEGDEDAETSRFITDVEAFRETVNRSASSFFPDSGAYAIKSIGPLGWVLLALTLASAVIVVCGPLLRKADRASS